MKNRGNKYLLISPCFPPPFIGGSKVWTLNMVENAPENFDILTSSLKKGYKEVVNPRHKVFRSRFLWDSDGADPTLWDLFLSYSYILFWVIKRRFVVKYEAIVAGCFDFANGWLFILGKILHIPVIGLGNAEEFTLALYGKTWKYFIKRHWIKFTHKKAAGFVVVCEFCKDILVSLGVDPNTIYVVPSSISFKKLPPKRKRIESGYNILSVGRLVERKGFHHLIDAVKILKEEIPEIKLTIVGDGPFKPVLLNKVEKNNMEDFVSIRGKLSDEELSELYSKSNLFVLAHMMLENGDTEGCPTVFSEASGNGLPVIGGNDAGSSTAIIHGKTGYLVNSRDINELAYRIKMILTNPELAEAMGKAGREKVKREHVPQVIGPKFSEAIKKIVSMYYNKRRGG